MSCCDDSRVPSCYKIPLAKRKRPFRVIAKGEREREKVMGNRREIGD